MPTTANFVMNFKANTAQAKAQLVTLRQELSAFNASTGMAIAGFGNMLSTAFKASIAAFAGVTVATAVAIAAVKDFDKNLTHAAAIAQLSTRDMYSLGDSINELSVRFAQSAGDMSEGVVELTKAGLTMAEIEQVMDDITMAMMANSISFESAAQTGIFAVKQFGDSMADMPAMFDVIQKVTQETIMDFGDMQQALQYAGSTAQLAGVPFAELMSIMGTLSQRAMEMGIASRSVNQMMMSLIDNTDAMQEWIDEMGLGISIIKDGRLNLTDMIDAFSKLDLTMEDLKRSSEIFTVRAMRSWGLLVTGADEYKKLLNEDIPNAYGTLAKVAERQQQTIAFKLSQMKEVLLAPIRQPEFIEQLGKLLDELVDPLQDISELLVKGLYNFLQWTMENKDTLTDFFTRFVDLIFRLIEPLYNIGNLLMKFVNGNLNLVITLKLLMSLNFHQYLGSMIKAYLTLEKVQLTDIKLMNMQIQAAANLAVSFAGLGMSAYLMGAAMGDAAEDMMYLMMIMGALQGSMGAAMFAPPGFKIPAMIGGGLLGAAVPYATYNIGKNRYSPMEKPDFSEVSNMFSNMDYTPSPGYGNTGSSGTSGYSSGLGGPSTNVYVNVEGSILAEKDLERTIRRTVDS